MIPSHFLSLIINFHLYKGKYTKVHYIRIETERPLVTNLLLVHTTPFFRLLGGVDLHRVYVSDWLNSSGSVKTDALIGYKVIT